MRVHSDQASHRLCKVVKQSHEGLVEARLERRLKVEHEIGKDSLNGLSVNGHPETFVSLGALVSDLTHAEAF